MTREKRLIDRLNLLSLLLWAMLFIMCVSGGLTYSSELKMEELAEKYFPMSIVILAPMLAASISLAGLKVQLYILRLLGKQDEPADKAEES